MIAIKKNATTRLRLGEKERKQVDYAPETLGDDVGDSDAAKRPIQVEYTVLM